MISLEAGAPAPPADGGETCRLSLDLPMPHFPTAREAWFGHIWPILPPARSRNLTPPAPLPAHALQARNLGAAHHARALRCHRRPGDVVALAGRGLQLVRKRRLCDCLRFLLSASLNSGGDWWPTVADGSTYGVGRAMQPALQKANFAVHAEQESCVRHGLTTGCLETQFLNRRVVRRHRQC